jgi:hypothetical protein
MWAETKKFDEERRERTCQYLDREEAILFRYDGQRQSSAETRRHETATSQFESSAQGLSNEPCSVVHAVNPHGM